ncbi:MAG: hypothetical protein HY433_01160 [Candidatus Liptonbacteria bacterium]|nr:hypothetical protein [Candidatus Liptonbacteria bacterium]
MNIVIPLAGKDPRYLDLPKLLTDVRGKPLLAYVLEQLRIEPEDKLIFVVLREYVEKFSIDKILKSVAGEKAIIRILPNVTDGSPCSILEAARDLIDNETDLLVELGDVIRGLDNFYEDIKTHRSEVSGIIPVERRDMTGRPFGYVRTDENGFTEALLEKELTYVAPWATMGLYYFSHGKDFVWAAEEMIKNKSFVYHDMFFVGPVYNELIKRGDKVIISKNIIEMMLGTPEEVSAFGA